MSPGTEVARPALKAALVVGAVLVAILLAGRLIHRTPDVDEKGDGAALSLYTLEALDGRARVGPYGQYGWNHPGPFLFYVLAPLYSASGHHQMSVRWTALAVNVGAIIGILLIVRRLGRPELMMTTAIALCAHLLRVGGDFAFSAWNPHVTVLPIAVFVVDCAAIASGWLVGLPLAVVIGSFIVQSSVSLAPTVLALPAAGLGWWLAHHRTTGRERKKDRLAGALGVSVCLGVLLWSLPLADEIARYPDGNLSRIARFFDARDRHQSAGHALAMFSRYYVGPFAPQFRPPIGEPAAMTVPAWESFVALSSLGSLVVLAWVYRRVHRFEASLCAMCVTASLTGFLSAYRIPVIASDHQVFWLSVVGSVSLATVAALLIRRASVEISRLSWYSAAAFSITLVTVSVLATRAARWQTERSSDRPLAGLYLDLHNHLQQGQSLAGGSGVTVVHTDHTWTETIGLVLEFAKRGEHIAVLDDLVDQTGERYRMDRAGGRRVTLFDVNTDPDAPASASPWIISRHDRFLLADTDAIRRDEERLKTPGPHQN